MKLGSEKWILYRVWWTKKIFFFMWLLGTSILEKLFRESNWGKVKRLYTTKLDYWYTHKFGNVLYSRKVWTATTADNWMCAYHYRRPY
jgi:hypothetical protein